MNRQTANTKHMESQQMDTLIIQDIGHILISSALIVGMCAVLASVTLALAINR